MEITSIPESEPETMESDVQESTATKRAGFSTEYDGKTVRSSEVTFQPGERTRFHTHAGIQMLYVTDGEGVVGTRDEEQTVSEGDLIVFPPGEEHWHGTGEDADEPFSHLFFIVEDAGTETKVVD